MSRINVTISTKGKDGSGEVITTQQDTVICLAVTEEDNNINGRLMCKGRRIRPYMLGGILTDVAQKIVSDTTDDKAERAFLLKDIEKRLKNERRKIMESMTEKEKEESLIRAHMHLMEAMEKKG